MKVLVSFQTQEKEEFEGSRLRKSIKGALELSDVAYTDNLIDYYDVAHFLGVRDEGKINECVDNNIPVVVSALGAEDDSNASYLEYKFDKKGNKIINLSIKALRVLNKATIVIVPNEESKKFLISQGVESEIEIVSPGVNIARFDFSRLDEKELFYRYYGEDKSKKLVVCVGGYTKISGISTFINAAKKCPNTLFYYFGPSNKHIPLLLQKDIKFAPKNVKFKKIPTDDIYRSALINASIFLYPGYSTISVTTLLEAMASKCQLILREQPLFPDLLVDGVNSYLCKYSETLTSVTKDCLEGKLTSTVDNAYKMVVDHNLKSVGEKLKSLYEKAINIKKEIDYVRH